MVSFSCRISASLRELPESERRECSTIRSSTEKKLTLSSRSANLIDILKGYGDSIEGFRERVGENFARGHKEATGGIIVKASVPLSFV